MQRASKILFLLVIALFVKSSFAGFPEGVKAYNRQNYDRALKEMKPLAEQGNAQAQYYLGLIYDTNVNPANNHEEAIKWYLKSAAQGYALGQNGLGEAYLSQALNLEVDHKTVDKDLYAQAFQWTSKAAEQGLVNAQSRLGELYHEGWGVTKSHTLAMQWYRKVTSGGHHNVLFNIGQLYEHGDGVKASRVVADALYHLSGIYEASDPNGDHEHPITGGALLFDLETKMSTQEKAAASKLTEDMFKAKDPLIALDQYVAHPTVVEVLVYSPENGKKSLCADTEDSLFSCATKTRFISLCASKNLSVTSGTMQYRVEKEGKLEFTFPENNVQPSTVFFNGTDGFGRANLSSIVFHNGEYSYLLYTIHDKFIPYSGVEIQRGEKLISALTCLNDTDGFDPNEVEMKKAELPVAPQ